MLQWVRERNDFQYVLLLDISRMGRFQDNDLFGYYELGNFGDSIEWHGNKVKTIQPRHPGGEAYAVLPRTT